jgi:type II secretory pathway pseudopilin PulG
MWAWLERIKGGLVLLGLALVALVSIFYRGRATGRQAERQERAEQINEQAAQARQEVRDVQQETARMDDAAIADELKRDWVRGAGKSRR